MSDLAERLEGAEGGSRELDAAVEVAVRAIEAERTGLAREHRAKWRASASGLVGDAHTQYMSEPVTTSLDAALSLAGRVLPGWHWSIYDTDGVGKACAQIEPPEFSCEPTTGSAATPALALCAAIIRARQNTGEEG